MRVCAYTFLQRACVGGGVSSNDVEDAQQLQDVLHPAGVLAAARLRLRHLSGQAQDLTALIGCEGARAQTARAPADTDAVLAQVLEEGNQSDERSDCGTSRMCDGNTLDHQIFAQRRFSAKVLAG